MISEQEFSQLYNTAFEKAVGTPANAADSIRHYSYLSELFKLAGTEDGKIIFEADENNHPVDSEANLNWSFQPEYPIPFPTHQ